MGYGARIVLDSIAPSGKRLTTWELTYPRFVHAELMTHRLFSRNSASSRAIPTGKLMARIQEDPALPVWWGKNQAGMQAREELSDEPVAIGHTFDPYDQSAAFDTKSEPSPREMAKRMWLTMRNQMLDGVAELTKIGLHKQIANRPLEAWMFITVLVTSTDFTNWFHQRHHKDAQPEIQWVAREMWPQYHQNKPRLVPPGEWHMPFILPSDVEWLGTTSAGARAVAECQGRPTEVLKRLSVARCARVSYLQHDGVHDPEKDLELVGKLALARLEDVDPKHWSPFEHVAQSMSRDQWNDHVDRTLRNARERGEMPAAHHLGNFTGWHQYRKTFRGEHVEQFGG